MTDRRFLHANQRVAHAALEGSVDSHLRLTQGDMRRLALPVTDLRRAANGPRDKQMLFGQSFVMLEDVDGWAFGFDPVDNYAGYVPSAALRDPVPVTHRVTHRLSHVYSAPDIKSPEHHALSFLSEIAVIDETDQFVALETGGFVPKQHVAALDWQVDDPASVAEGFLGTPYLWGGNSACGIDCSGLVQLALYASRCECPRDSDLQANCWKDTADLQRGDMVFWKGHVGMMLDSERLIHANAFHMSVAIEPLDQARERIAKNEFGEVTRTTRPRAA